MLNKCQRIIWILAGICFLAASVLHIKDGEKINFTFFILIIAAVLSFANSYFYHKKVQRDKTKL